MKGAVSLQLCISCQHSANHDIASVLQAKVAVAEQTEKDINITRMQYVPVAVRSQILYFCVSDLSNVDPMYQYSLEWFLNIFLLGIRNSEKAGACPEQPLLSPPSPHICSRSACESGTCPSQAGCGCSSVTRSPELTWRAPSTSPMAPTTLVWLLPFFQTS